jgi:hypothetical protein
MIVNVLLLFGQSNSLGNDVGETGTYAACRYRRITLGAGTTDSGWVDLTTGFGKDVTLGRLMLEAGHPVAVFSTGRGGTTLGQYVPVGVGNIYYAEHIAALTLALSELPAEYPANTHFRYWHITDQGESEARDSNLAIVSDWANKHGEIIDDLEAQLGITVERLVIQTNSDIEDKTYPGVLESQQLLAAGDASRLVNRNGVEYEAGGVHMTSAGYIETGELVFAAIQGLLNMGTLSAAERTVMMDHVTGVAASTPATEVEFAAFVGGVEVATGGYARTVITNDGSLWTVAGRTVENAVDIDWVTATGANWGLIDEIRAYNADTSAEMGRHTLALAVQIDDGDTLQVVAGAFVVTAAPGALSDDEAERLLAHQWSGAAYTPETDVEFAYYDGDPQGAGAEITGTGYARDVLANDGTTWSAASGGACRTLIDVSVGTAAAADWDEATHWALFDAAGTGLMFSAALPVARQVANGETETIQAGRIRPSFT